jgi:hypothetical protein
MESCIRFPEDKLKLKVNRKKSMTGNPAKLKFPRFSLYTRAGKARYNGVYDNFSENTAHFLIRALFLVFSSVFLPSLSIFEPPSPGPVSSGLQDKRIET